MIVLSKKYIPHPNRVYLSEYGILLTTIKHQNIFSHTWLPFPCSSVPPLGWWWFFLFCSTTQDAQKDKAL